MLQLIGLNVHVEEPTAVGRIDAVIEVGNHAFILELKLNGSADKAMEQIISRRYTEKYLAAGFTVTSIGAVFDKKLRTMTECQIL